MKNRILELGTYKDKKFHLHMGIVGSTLKGKIIHCY